MRTGLVNGHALGLAKAPSHVHYSHPIRFIGYNVSIGRFWGPKRSSIARAPLLATTSGQPAPSPTSLDTVREDILEFARAVEISIAAIYFVSFYLWEQMTSSISGVDFDTNKVASQLQDIVTRLGPTFVKLAQTASMRPDLVGDSYAKSLAKLQDSVKPFDNQSAFCILESELGKPIPEIFSKLSEQPIASASMGQVYRGTLVDSMGGAEVAVKVRRPGAYEKIKTDIGLLRNTIGIVQKLAGITRDLRILVDDVGQGLLGECDFNNEVKNSKAFLNAHKSLKFITIPTPVEELCTDKILVSQWVDGTSPVQLIQNAEEGSKDQREILNLVRMGIQCSLSQLLVTGCMHGDPHSGNLLLTRDGKLCYLDFGLLVYVPPNDRQAMMAALVHLGLGEWSRLVDDLENLRLLKPNTDKKMLAVDLEKEFQAVMAGGDNSGGSETTLKQLPLLSLQTTKLNFSTLIGVLFRLAFKYKFLLPSFFPLVVRSVSSLEGVALSVDPDFKLVAAGMPVVLNQLLSDRRPASEQLLKELLLMPGGDALRADETTRQILQVWLSAAQQVHKVDQGEEQLLSKSGLSKSTAVDMKNILLDRKNVPLRKILMMSNPASTVAAMPKESREQLLSILAEILSSDAAGDLASGMLKSSPEARAQRKRLAMLFRASVPKVMDSPPKNIFELVKFTIAVVWALMCALYTRCISMISSWFGRGDTPGSIENPPPVY